jgi:dTDP-4-dehydrorhamnose reductase
MRVLLTGASGFLGAAVLEELLDRGHEVLAVAHVPPRAGDAAPRAARWLAEDLELPGAAERLVAAEAPEAVVHAAALADIAPCNAAPARARRLNGEVPGELAAACTARGARLLHVSTDQVFDGSHGGWREDDEPAPLHEYGRSKLEGERAVAAACATALVLRPGLVTGRAPPGRRSATTALLDTLARGVRPRLFTDELRTPVASVDVARALADLLEREEVWRAGSLPGAPGRLLHLGGAERMSRLELGRREARAAGLDPELCEAGTRVEAGVADERPADLTLDSRRALALLGWTPRALAE